MTPKPAHPAKAGQHKTQSQRREETRHKVMACATEIFGKKGYQDTSLDDIAKQAGVTITPIYHYFGNKLTLFEAVTEALEEQLVERLNQIDAEEPDQALTQSWAAFIEQCQVPGFVQIVLVDAPFFLGRERWQNTVVVKKVLEAFEGPLSGVSLPFESPLDQELAMRILMATLAETALMVGRNPGYDGGKIIETVISLLPK